MPVGVWVTVKVPDEVKEEFLKVMEIDMKGSRAEEASVHCPLCYLNEIFHLFRWNVRAGFDLLDQGGGVYNFYEVLCSTCSTNIPHVYASDEAAAHHKTLPHYKAWADFKAKNMETIGASQTVNKFTLVGEP
eukprot:scaffold258346_cov33-Tisochrysis_lutea.AAC.1